MGNKLDAFLLRRRFRASKFKATASLAIHRLALLKNQRQARCSIARSDVVQLLNSNHHDRALLRVEQVMKEQNMLDVFVVLEGYCHLLIERIHLFEQEKDCPEDLVEGVSSLIYAAIRCGEFPELQELRRIFTSRFGKEFAARAIELRNNCEVNPKIIQKLSTKAPSLENKMKVLREIASDNKIDLPMEDTSPETIVESKDPWQEKQQKAWPSSPSGGGRNESLHSDEERERGRMRKYKDVADAAQAAFESAAYAAAAARAAVVLSRSESTDPETPTLRSRKQTAEVITAKFHEDERMKNEIEFENIHPVQNYDPEQFEENEGGGGLLRRLLSGSDMGSSSDDEEKIEQKNVVFDESDGEENIKDELGLNIEKKTSEGVEPLNIFRRPISVRTRWAQGR